MYVHRALDFCIEIGQKTRSKAKPSFTDEDTFDASVKCKEFGKDTLLYECSSR